MLASEPFLLGTEIVTLHWHYSEPLRVVVSKSEIFSRGCSDWGRDYELLEVFQKSVG